MSRRRLTRDEKRQQTRDALLRSAAAIFARRGYHAATVDEIAENAGYSVGALYSNFADKEDLLFATAEHYVVEQAQTWAQYFEEADTTERQITGPADAWMRALSNGPEQFLLFVELWAYAARNPQIRQAFVARWTTGREFMADAATKVAEGRNQTLSAAHQTELVAMVDALGIGLAVRKLVDPDAVPDDLFGSLLNDVVPALLDAWQDET